MHPVFSVHVAHALQHLPKEFKSLILRDALVDEVGKGTIRAVFDEDVGAVFDMLKSVVAHDGGVIERG